jgi:hypothetical protein
VYGTGTVNLVWQLASSQHSAGKASVNLVWQLDQQPAEQHVHHSTATVNVWSSMAKSGLAA